MGPSRNFHRMLAAAVILSLVGSGFSAGAQAPKSKNPVVVIETSMGDITVELNKEKAPKTVENFLSYVKEDFYKDTIFHRVIPGFMIQGGGFTVDMKRKPTKPPIPNEAGNGLKNVRGAIAMARTADVHSATAQFFIDVADKPQLDHRGETPDAFGYAVFGKVIAGMAIVERIENTATGSRGSYQNVPVVPVVIKSIKLKS
jgi:cyclophilin family peptidyl-prolyl cis-trans isomerase